MATFPQTGGSEFTWGDELRDFFSPFFDLNTGEVNVDGLLSNDSVSGTKIIDNTVTGTKLTDGSVTEAKLATDSVTVNKIAASSITEAKLATDSVSETKILDGSVIESKLGTGSVTENKIGASAITSGKIANNSVTSVKILDGAVTESKLGTGAVTTDKILDNSITEDKLAFSFSGGFIDITYSTLIEMVTGGTLELGQKYNITDKDNSTIEALTTLTYIPNYKNIVTIDITGLTTLDLTNYNYANIINISSSGATETIDTITIDISTLPFDWIFELRPISTLQLTITGTPTPLTLDGQIAMYSSSNTLDGAKGERIKFIKLPGLYGVYQE